MHIEGRQKDVIDRIIVRYIANNLALYFFSWVVNHLIIRFVFYGLFCTLFKDLWFGWN